MVGGLMIGNNNKKRVSIMSSSLSLFSPINNNNNNKSIHKSSVNKSSFQQNRAVVGLGIVAALGGEEREPSRAVVLPRSNPIPILPPVAAAVVLPNLNITNHNSGAVGVCDDDTELSEDYTCVISHIGDNLIKKTEYFDGVLATLTHSTTATSSGVSDEVAAVKAASFQAADFLKSCYLCDKHLHGLDIFMYRGEKAFCSAECRYEQMVKDERKEKEKQKKKICGSLGKGATTMKTMMKNKPSFEFSSSTPCSSPIQLIAGIVAA